MRRWPLPTRRARSGSLRTGTLLRSRLVLVFPLLLLFAEQGAWLHKLSHAYYSAVALTEQVSSNAGFVDNRLCRTCEAFAQVANPVGASPAQVAVSPPAYLRAPAPPCPRTCADAPAPRSRGPPVALI